jgi:t-SNARE complex subunit (syntaxin)
MKLQDDMLVDISKGVDRLHGQATTIGEETKSHIKLIDNLENNVDDATEALTSEAKHAEEVKRKAEGCYMYICIAIEFVIIILLLLIGFAT